MKCSLDIGRIILIFSFVLLYACKKEEQITQRAELFSVNNSYSSNGIICYEDPGEVVRVIELEDEQHLASAMNDPANHDGVHFIFKPDLNGEFIITGQYFNTSATSHNQFVAIFDGYKNIQFSSGSYTAKTKIVFKPKQTGTSPPNIFNKRLFVFRNCENVIMHNLEIYVDQSEAVRDKHYYTALINLAYNNHNVTFEHMKFQGTDAGTNFTGNEDVENLWYTGAISSGLDFSPNGNEISNAANGFIDNTNICITQSEFYNFRIYGMYFTNGNGMYIHDNIIKYIWENDQGFATQAGAIHLKLTTKVEISNNEVSNIQSLYPNQDPSLINILTERFQHGFYVSTGNVDLNIINNTLTHISGIGIIIKSSESSTILNTNVLVHNNIVKYTKNSGFLARPTVNLTVTNNYFYHCFSKIADPYYQDPNSPTNKQSRGIIDITDESDANQTQRAMFSNLVFKNNNIKNRWKEIYDANYNWTWTCPYPSPVPAPGGQMFVSVIRYQLDTSDYNAYKNNTAAISNNAICLEDYTLSTPNVCDNERLFWVSDWTQPSGGTCFTAMYDYQDIKNNYPNLATVYYLTAPGNCNPGNVACQ